MYNQGNPYQLPMPQGFQQQPSYGAQNYASSLGDVFGGVNSIFAGNRTANMQVPAAAGESYINQIPKQTEQYYMPYIQAGQESIPTLQEQYSKLMGNPELFTSQYEQMINSPQDVMNKLGGGYKQSPGYEWTLNQALGAGNNAAAAGGMAGTPAHQQFAMTTATGLANQDYYNYLNKMMDLYGGGLQGAQNIYNRGLTGTEGLYRGGQTAATDYANIIASTLATQAAQASLKQQQQNYQQQLAQQQQSQGATGIGSGIGGIAGGILGGPGGAAVGSAVGGGLGSLYNSIFG